MRQHVSGLHWPNRDQRKPQREPGAGCAASYISLFLFFAPLFFLNPGRSETDQSSYIRWIWAWDARENANNTFSHRRIWPTLAAGCCGNQICAQTSCVCHVFLIYAKASVTGGGRFADVTAANVSVAEEESISRRAERRKTLKSQEQSEEEDRKSSPHTDAGDFKFTLILSVLSAGFNRHRQVRKLCLVVIFLCLLWTSRGKLLLLDCKCLLFGESQIGA